MHILVVSLAVIALIVGTTFVVARRGVRDAKRRRAGLCAFCNAILDADSKYWVEGRLVCGACAARSRRRIVAALWSLGAVALLSLVAGIIGNVQDWRRGYGVSLFGVVVALFAPLSLTGITLFVLSSMKADNRLARKFAALDHRHELLRTVDTESTPDPPAT